MSNDIATEIRRQERGLREALLNLDGDWFLANWTPDATYVHASGRRESTQEFVDRLRLGGRTYESVETDELHFTDHGDVAILTGIAKLDISTAEDRKRINTLFTRVYVQRDGRWRLAANHSSPYEQAGN